MLAAELLQSLITSGRTATIAGDTLRIRPPVTDPATIEAVRQHKAEILHLVGRPTTQMEEQPTPPPMTDAHVAAEHLAMQRAGTVPSWYTLPGECSRCGLVWLPDWASSSVRECPWCSIKVPFDRPTRQQVAAELARIAPV